MTIDPFLLRGAALGAAWRAERGGAGGAVYHAAGGSTLPPLVGAAGRCDAPRPRAVGAPEPSSARRATRFGQRIRASLLRDADAVIVGSDAVGAAARRLLRVRHERLRVVPFAPARAFSRSRVRTVRRSGSDLACPGAISSTRAVRRPPGPRHAPARAGRAGRRRRGRRRSPGKPRGHRASCSSGRRPDDRAALARAAAREHVGDALAYAPHLPDSRLAAVVRGARAAILPVLSEAAGFAAIDALACGTPIVASAVGALPELVGAAGILVPPREPGRLAAALQTVWTDRRVHARIYGEARARAAERRTWAEVAAATRESMRRWAPTPTRGRRRGGR